MFLIASWRPKSSADGQSGLVDFESVLVPALALSDGAEDGGLIGVFFDELRGDALGDARFGSARPEGCGRYCARRRCPRDRACAGEAIRGGFFEGLSGFVAFAAGAHEASAEGGGGGVGRREPVDLLGGHLESAGGDRGRGRALHGIGEAPGPASSAASSAAFPGFVVVKRSAKRARAVAVMGKVAGRSLRSCSRMATASFFCV